MRIVLISFLGHSLNDELAVQLALAGPTGVAAAAAISSTKKRKRPHAFETNPSIRKRQQTRLLRKLKQNIEEYNYYYKSGNLKLKIFIELNKSYYQASNKSLKNELN